MRVFGLRRWQYMERRAGQVQVRACARFLRRSEGSAAPEGVLVMAVLSICEYWPAGPAPSMLWSAPLSCGLPSSHPVESLPLSLSHGTSFPLSFFMLYSLVLLEHIL